MKQSHMTSRRRGANENDPYKRATNSQFQTMLRFGILLPFTYLNDENKLITLTTDEIISLGWAKIKEA